jgi:hypothetical protein
MLTQNSVVEGAQIHGDYEVGILGAAGQRSNWLAPGWRGAWRVMGASFFEAKNLEARRCT